MSPLDPAIRHVTVSELIGKLGAMSRGECCGLAFDGDGTLWSGDVSDDVFLAACQADWFVETVEPSLRAILANHNLSSAGTRGEQARRLFESEKRGLISERLLFEFMTWCYAGRSVEEVSAFADTILTDRGIDQRVRMGYVELFDWARSNGHQVWLVTASPLPIVRVAAQKLGIEEHRIVAARASVTDAGRIATDMAEPVPYREQKPLQLKARSAMPRLLAAFGDSPFDIDLLSAAELAVAVNPKPALLDRLGTLGQIVIFDL